MNSARRTFGDIFDARGRKKRIMKHTLVAVIIIACVAVPPPMRAQQAGAPCAWVAWRNWQHQGDLADKWYISDAVPTRTECVELNRRDWRSTKERATGPNVVSVNGVEGSFLYVQYKQAWMLHEYLCPPSNLDPRPR